MKIFSKATSVLLLIMLVASANTGFSQEVIDPDRIFQLDAVNLDEFALVIDDRYFKMDLRMVVYDVSGNQVQRTALRQGQKIKIKLSNMRSGPHSLVSEVRIVSNPARGSSR